MLLLQNNESKEFWPNVEHMKKEIHESLPDYVSAEKFPENVEHLICEYWLDLEEDDPLPAVVSGDLFKTMQRRSFRQQLAFRVTFAAIVHLTGIITLIYSSDKLFEFYIVMAICLCAVLLLKLIRDLQLIRKTKLRWNFSIPTAFRVLITFLWVFVLFLKSSNGFATVIWSFMVSLQTCPCCVAFLRSDAEFRCSVLMEIGVFELRLVSLASYLS